jgi:hypothetical protein
MGQDWGCKGTMLGWIELSWSALDSSFLVGGGVFPFGGRSSSSEGYPSHFRPKFEHLKHSGFVSSHFTWRFLYHWVSKYDENDHVVMMWKEARDCDIGATKTVVMTR